MTLWQEVCEHYGISDEAASIELPIASRTNDGFKHFCAVRVLQALEYDPSISLQRFFYDDLLLAYKASKGEREAINWISEKVVYRCRNQLALKFGHEAEDAAQQVGLALFSDGAQNGLPLVTAFRGQSAMSSWIYLIMYRRLVRNTKRASREVVTENVGDYLNELALGPQFESIRKQHRELFKQSINRSIESLPTEQRLLLKQVILDRVSTASIAKQRGVHPATVRRWLADIRGVLARRTRQQLFEAVGSDHTVSSVMQMLSGWDASIFED